jgi:ParB/Sulfiredoxin domain
MSEMLASAEEPTPDRPPMRAVESVEVAALKPGVRLRLGGVKSDHLESIVLTVGQWPPIVVRRSDHAIVDGHYRYLAAQRLGLRTLECTYFDGEEPSAFVEAVRCNRSHGLPLSVRERGAAARRILESYPEWSDRRIGTMCCLAAGTVGRIRASMARTIPGPADMDSCIGLDGRRRPRDPRSSRERIVTALQSRPDGSLREIARLTGTSPATVKAVRDRLGISPEEPHPEPPPWRDLSCVIPVAPSPARWMSDSALAAATEGDRFLDWFGRTSVGEDWRGFIEGIPVSRVYEIADEARRRAAAWQEFALVLEGRIRGRRPSFCA